MDDVVFISSQVRQALLASPRRGGPGPPDPGERAKPGGAKQDKHGNPWQVYEVNHANLMSDSLRSLKRLGSEA